MNKYQGSSCKCLFNECLKWLNVLAKFWYEFTRNFKYVYSINGTLPNIFPSYESSHNDLQINACLCMLRSFKHDIKFQFGIFVAENWHCSFDFFFGPQFPLKHKSHRYRDIYNHTRTLKRKQQERKLFRYHISHNITHKMQTINSMILYSCSLN